MTTGQEILIIYILFTVCINIQGLQLSMGKSSSNEFCGRLWCLEEDASKDGRILSILEMNIYDITHTEMKIKLASVLLSDGVLHVELSKILDLNGTGSISRYHAEMILDFLNEDLCLYTVFQCELAFINVTSQTDMISQTLFPGSQNDSCQSLISRQLTKLMVHSQHMTEELEEIKKELNFVKQQNTVLETKLDELLHVLSGVEIVFPNTTVISPVISPNTTVINLMACTRGAAHASSREVITLWGNYQTLCDTVTDGGGWVIVQRRSKGDMEFYRVWTDYENGFGTLDTDFWIGNNVIHNLTSRGYTELRIDLEREGRKYFAHYSNFSVADELSKYRLSVSGYSGTANDSLSYHDGMMFSTFDQDNDISHSHCAERMQGAWWFNNCRESDLNGKWGISNDWGIYWHGVMGSQPFSLTEMKIRLV